jgi:hypothetical protein
MTACGGLPEDAEPGGMADGCSASQLVNQRNRSAISSLSLV